MTLLSNRITAVSYLAVLVFTSMPVSVGLLGWCPCGCLPATLGDPDSSKGESESEGHHDSDSSHCRGCHPLPYCPLLDHPPTTQQSISGEVAVEATVQIPPANDLFLIRPPRV
mgnify:CR=1 FL=1